MSTALDSLKKALEEIAWGHTDNPSLTARAALEELRMNDPAFVNFGNIARKRLGMQCQYACQYLVDPELSEGIRWEGTLKDYHRIHIHQDDVETFIKRALAWRRARGIIA